MTSPRTAALEIIALDAAFRDGKAAYEDVGRWNRLCADEAATLARAYLAAVEREAEVMRALVHQVQRNHPYSAACDACARAAALLESSPQ